MENRPLIEVIKLLREDSGEVVSDGKITIDLKRAEEILSEAEVAKEAKRGLDEERVRKIRDALKAKMKADEDVAKKKALARAEKYFGKFLRRVEKARRKGRRYVHMYVWGYKTRQGLSWILGANGFRMRQLVADMLTGAKWGRYAHKYSLRVRIDLLEEVNDNYRHNSRARLE